MHKPQQQETLLTALRSQGWQLEIEQWEEPLSLPVDSSLQERWLGKDRPFRAVLADGSQGESEAALLRRLLKTVQGAQLPQRLLHLRISGHRTAA